MEEIKVGEYVRDKAGNIAKVIKNNNDIFEIELNTGVRINQFIEFIVEHSKNIIDLIEVGDYVNGKKVICVLDGFANGTMEIELSNHRKIYRTCIGDIKSIVTKEQMEAIKYVVE